MAITTTLYNHTTKLFANGEVSLADLKVMLLDNDLAALFDATDTDMTGLTGAEVSGFGWTSGGKAIASAAITTTSTNDAKLDGDDISVTATGGQIGPAKALVIYDDNSNKPLGFVDFGQDEAAGDTTDFKISWNAAGILTWTYT